MFVHCGQLQLVVVDRSQLIASWKSVLYLIFQRYITSIISFMGFLFSKENA